MKIEDEAWGFDDHLVIPEKRTENTYPSGRITYDPFSGWTMSYKFEIFNEPKEIPEGEIILKYKAK